MRKNFYDFSSPKLSKFGLKSKFFLASFAGSPELGRDNLVDSENDGVEAHSSVNVSVNNYDLVDDVHDSGGAGGVSEWLVEIDWLNRPISIDFYNSSLSSPQIVT